MKKLAVFFVLILIFLSCKNPESEAHNLEVLEEAEYASKYDVVPPPRTQNIQLKKDKPTVEKKLVKTGRLTFETDSIFRTKATITQLTKNYEGYISSENSTKNSIRINQYLTVRIPTKKFDSFLEELSKGVNEYDEKTITISDVTERFYDLTSRLKNKRELEKRYLQILNKAKSVKEILDVEREIGKLREDIESVEGRLKYLSNQVSLSTLHITFYKEVKEKSSGENKFLKAFKKGIQGVKTLILGLISIWPFVILLFIVYFIIRRKTKRKNQN